MPRRATFPPPKVDDPIDHCVDGDPDPDPEPPIAPPVIILAETRLGQGYAHQAEPQPPTSPSLPKNSASRYNLRSKSNKKLEAKRPDPSPEPEPEPEPAPPIIILPRKSSSPSNTSTHPTPPHSLPPESSTSTLLQPNSAPSPTATSTTKMGSKLTKVREEVIDGKLHSQSKADKDEMKEPPNYYNRRSKSMRRKAGSGQVSGQGSGGGLS